MSPYRSLAVGAAKAISERTERSVVVVVEDDAATMELVTLGATCGSMAQIVLTLCEFSLAQPRPTDCATCGDAYDRMAQAAAILRGVAGRC